MTTPLSAMDRAFLTGDPSVGELILVRHGEQDYPRGPGSVAVREWDDPPLSERGRQQAAAVARALARERVDAVYTSELRRAADTGAAIAEVHGLAPVIVPELREIGVFCELPPDKAPVDVIGADALEEARARFAAERCWDAYPHSERSAAFRSRCVGAIEGVLANHMGPGEHVVVACHGGVIGAYLSELLGVKEDMFFRPAHASVHRLAVAGERRIVISMNETHHLVDGETSLVSH